MPHFTKRELSLLCGLSYPRTMRVAFAALITGFAMLASPANLLPPAWAGLAKMRLCRVVGASCDIDQLLTKTYSEVLPPGEAPLKYAPPGEESTVAPSETRIAPPGGDESIDAMSTGSIGSSGKISSAEAVAETRSFALSALSRGRGVSQAGLQAVADFRNILQSMKADGKVTRITESRIGLEGETKICAEFATPEAARQVWTQMQNLTAGIDLVQLQVGNCESP